MPTNISWADEVFNPVTGCTPISTGCKNCFARAMTKRFPSKFPDGFKVTLHPERLNQLRNWRIPKRVFVCSMSDLFHDDVPDDFIERTFNVIENFYRHTFMILTKRPKRMQKFIASHWGVAYQPQFIWLGVSVEDQETADERIPRLLQIPAAVRFVSYEPALAALDMGYWFHAAKYDRVDRKISLLIAGGESGPGHRPDDIQWYRDARDQCVAAGVKYFFKQRSGPRPGMDDTLDGRKWQELPEANHG